ncbi:lysophospholipase [Podospora aff. communis PSN243]|uniref:Lysophospholipase n=1 Tax=Podospora aff. communis PSN243 TaxID=3040156 RepID=A0AAV9GQ25_9PEZI|nr:lysophospholipase [Podospora aff. communis PSN243]
MAGTCPAERPVVRPAEGLSADESRWLGQREKATHSALVSVLERTNIGNIDVRAYLQDIVDDGGTLPRIGIAVSGGGYRALMNGAGALGAFHNRTTASTEVGGLGGILQASTYLSGLSGGSWLVGSLYMANFTSVQSIVGATSGPLSQLWQFNETIIEGPATLSTRDYYQQIQDAVDAKANAGYHTTITNTWGRSPSPAYTLSSAFDNGTLAPDAPCVRGVDNIGFIVGTSSSLFNQAFLQLGRASLDGFIPEFFVRSLNNTLADISEENTDVASWPKPFFGYRPADNPNAESRTLDLVDGAPPTRPPTGPTAPPSSPPLAARPLAAPTSAPPRRIASPPFPPSAHTFVNLGLNRRPTFFGCNPDLTGTASPPGPLIVYLPNAPYSYFSNETTFQMEYTPEEWRTIMRNGADGVTLANSSLDAQWPARVGCAILERSLRRTGTKFPSKCDECFARYCWNGTVNETTPAEVYSPAMILTSSAGRRGVGWWLVGWGLVGWGFQALVAWLVVLVVWI